MEELQKIINQMGTLWLRASMIMEKLRGDPAPTREYTYEDWLNEGGSAGTE